MKPKVWRRDDNGVPPRLSTIMIRLSRALPASAMMLVRPPLMAVTQPAGLTLATLVSRLDQVIVADDTAPPWASRATAWTNSESLKYTRAPSRDKLTDVTNWLRTSGTWHTVAMHVFTSTPNI